MKEYWENPSNFNTHEECFRQKLTLTVQRAYVNKWKLGPTPQCGIPGQAG